MYMLESKKVSHKHLRQVYDYFKKNDQLIAVNLSKQRELDADPQALQQIKFIGMLKTRSNVFTILEKSKETILQFYRGTAKVM